ncbi:MAG TPA: lipopolysaccharide heptosyltransferase II [Acidobacteriota bacterium]|nr:lipopolysaccharide heptosyltransferase II [Acidobacteriota bacterium]
MSTTGDRPLLVRLPNWLGDLILAWPVVEGAAREAVLFVGPAAFEPLLRARHPRAAYLPWSRARRYAPIGAIRRAAPRAALLLTESFSSALLVALAGVPERIGYGAEGRRFLLTKRVPRGAPARATPRSEEYRRLAQAARLVLDPGAPRLEATEGERASAADLLARLGAGADPYLVVAPGAAYGPAKQWGPERFGAVAASLAVPRDWRVVAVGADADRAASESGLAEARRRGAATCDTTGATDLSALLGVLAGAALVLTNDSGVMHAAAALGRPTVALFGSTSPVWTSASAPWVANLYAGYPCSPCYRRTCSIGYGCLRSLETAAAVAAGERLLG